ATATRKVHVCAVVNQLTDDRQPSRFGRLIERGGTVDGARIDWGAAIEKQCDDFSLSRRRGTSQGLNADPVSCVKRGSAIKQMLCKFLAALFGSRKQRVVDLDRARILLDLLIALF